jgi:hypothetical protein
LAYIREIQPETAIADEIVDTEMMFTIQQRGELGAKVAAINTYNKLKGRIIDKLQTDNKLEIIYVNHANQITGTP